MTLPSGILFKLLIKAIEFTVNFKPQKSKTFGPVKIPAELCSGSYAGLGANGDYVGFLHVCKGYSSSKSVLVILSVMSKKPKGTPILNDIIFMLPKYSLLKLN